MRGLVIPGETIGRRFALYLGAMVGAPVILLLVALAVNQPWFASAFPTVIAAAVALYIVIRAERDHATEDRRYRTKTVSRYLATLPDALRRDYGSRGPYTVRQIIAAMERRKMDPRWSEYAVVIFGTKEGFGAMTGGNYASFEQIRHEVAVTFFHGRDGFTIDDIVHRYGDDAHDASPAHGHSHDHHPHA